MQTGVVDDDDDEKVFLIINLTTKSLLHHIIQIQDSYNVSNFRLCRPVESRGG